MRRRSLLAAVAGTGLGGLAGCSGLDPDLDVGPLDGQERTADGDADAGDDRTADTPAGSGPSTPTLPYAASTAAENVPEARGIEVQNDRETTAYVTLVVADGDRTVYADSRTVRPGETVKHDGLVRRRGVYRVLFETGDGARAVHGWSVGDDWLGSKLLAEVTDGGVETRQLAICAPDCPPIAASGTATDLPRSDNTDPGREVVGALKLRNDTAETVAVDVSVGRGSRALLDYRYRIPAGVTVLVPVAREEGAYALSVRANGGRLDRDWHLPEEPLPTLRVGREGPTPDCARDRLRVVGVRNGGDRARDVGLRLRADGRTVAERSVEVPADGAVDRLGASARGEALSVEVRAGDRTLTGDWTLCPPRPLRVLASDRLLALLAGDRVVVSTGG